MQQSNPLLTSHTLRAQGLSLRAIARELNLHIQTVRKYSRLPALPQRTFT